jgi:hypothetical protein
MAVIEPSVRVDTHGYGSNSMENAGDRSQKDNETKTYALRVRWQWMQLFPSPRQTRFFFVFASIKIEQREIVQIDSHCWIICIQ